MFRKTFDKSIQDLIKTGAFKGGTKVINKANVESKLAQAIGYSTTILPFDYDYSYRLLLVLLAQSDLANKLTNLTVVADYEEAYVVTDQLSFKIKCVVDKQAEVYTKQEVDQIKLGAWENQKSKIRFHSGCFEIDRLEMYLKDLDYLRLCEDKALAVNFWIKSNKHLGDQRTEEIIADKTNYSYFAQRRSILLQLSTSDSFIGVAKRRREIIVL